jgi:hypothetical protein
MLRIMPVMFCLTAVAVGARSFWVTDLVEWFHFCARTPVEFRRESLSIWSSGGGIRVSWGAHDWHFLREEELREGQLQHRLEDKLELHHRSNFPARTKPEYPWLGARDSRVAQLNLGWFSYKRGHRAPRLPLPADSSQSLELTFPHAVLVAAFGAWPVISFVRRRRLARTRAGFCRCGYDLRGGHERCPECGRVAQSQGLGDEPQSV